MRLGELAVICEPITEGTRWAILLGKWSPVEQGGRHYHRRRLVSALVRQHSSANRARHCGAATECGCVAPAGRSRGIWLEYR
jgi:hypothetical protein